MKFVSLIFASECDNPWHLHKYAILTIYTNKAEVEFGKYKEIITTNVIPCLLTNTFNANAMCHFLDEFVEESSKNWSMSSFL